MNRNTAISYYKLLRSAILRERIREAKEYKLDESYFGLLKRGEKVYVRVVENCSRESLMPIIQGLTLSGSTIYTDGWKAYDGLILNGYEHHRVFHHENEFARGKSHVNGIENFWSFAKGRLAKFNGCASDKFVLFQLTIRLWHGDVRRRQNG